MRFEGIASSTAVDREGEQMSPAALEDMAKAGRVELRAGHRGGERVGAVEECWRDGERLRVSGRLDETSPRARALWDRLRQGVRMALSVGGRKRVVRRYSPVAGRWVRMIEGAHLEHVAVCRPEEARCGEAEIVASGEGEVESRKSKVESGEGSLTPWPPLPAGEGEPDGENWPPVPLSAQIRAVRETVEGLQEGLGRETHASPPGPLSRACGLGEGEWGGEPHPLPSLLAGEGEWGGDTGWEAGATQGEQEQEAEAAASTGDARLPTPDCVPGRRRSLLVVKTGREQKRAKHPREDNDNFWKGVL
jgi:hypothetical protein